MCSGRDPAASPLLLCSRENDFDHGLFNGDLSFVENETKLTRLSLLVRETMATVPLFQGLFGEFEEAVQGPQGDSGRRRDTAPVRAGPGRVEDDRLHVGRASSRASPRMSVRSSHRHLDHLSHRPTVSCLGCRGVGGPFAYPCDRE